MDKKIEKQLNYEIVHLTDTSSTYYHEALRVYCQTITYDQKTNTNEIAYWVNHSNDFPNCKPLFFALILNNMVIGYAEWAYLVSNRILIIDYIILDSQYKSNSAFFAFFSLIINYIDSLGYDYDFITKEILCQYTQTQLHKEDIKKYELENFKVINSLYMHPQLEIGNWESNKEALLMIYQKEMQSMNFKKETYLSIVDSIYFKYYEIWDKPFWNSIDEETQNHIALIKNKETIEENIGSENIVLNGYPILATSGRPLIPENQPQKNINRSLIYAIFILIMTFLTLFFSKELNVELTSIAFVALAIIFIMLTFVALSDSKAAKIIEKLPVFSKLFALLK